MNCADDLPLCSRKRHPPRLGLKLCNRGGRSVCPRTMSVRCPYDVRTMSVRCPYDVRTVSIRRPYDVRTMSRRMSVVCPWYVPFSPVRSPCDVRAMSRYINYKFISNLSVNCYILVRNRPTPTYTCGLKSMPKSRDLRSRYFCAESAQSAK